MSEPINTMIVETSAIRNGIAFEESMVEVSRAEHLGYVTLEWIIPAHQFADFEAMMQHLRTMLEVQA
jgi:hypothetical protein